MIALNNGDKLRADASVADKIDYTLHGVVDDVVTQIADGQFAAAEADIYTASSDGVIIVTVVLVNRHNAAITCNLYLKPSGGTSRSLIPVDVSLEAGEALWFDGFNIALSDTADGDVNVTALPADTFAAEGQALGKGVLLQGDDGTDRHNVAVDADGSVQVDVVGALPAGSAKIGSIDAGKKSGTWTCISININTATTTELKAASGGHTFTVLTISLTIAAENNLTWKSASTVLSGPMDFGASGEPHGWQANLWPCGLKCATGEALNLTTSTTGQVSGFITVLDES